MTFSRYLTASAALVRDLQARGKRVYVWTVDEMARMRELLSWKVDGIMTDYPARLRAVFEEGRLPRRDQRTETRGPCTINPFVAVPPDVAVSPDVAPPRDALKCP
jgi:hypothetical protein